MDDIKTLVEEVQKVKKTQELILELLNKNTTELVKTNVQSETIIALVAKIYGMDKHISKDMVIYLKNCGFRIAEICAMFGCSASNICRILKGGDKHAND